MAHASSGWRTAPVQLTSRFPHPRWTREAWASIALVALFVGVTSWWLTQDRGIPIFDAGLHLSLTINVYEHLRSGDIGGALTLSVPYPPFTYLVGAMGMWIGGVGVAPPIVAENLIFVPLLALGCYNVGRLAFSPRAGLLAVVFALGSPLVTAQFHVFMTDAPQSAMVAVALWSIFASERFSRTWISAAAGVAVGLGMLIKEPFAFFVAGAVLVTIIRGGWRAWRGLAAFSIAALAIALPWYVSEFSQVHALAQGVATAHPGTKVVDTNIFPARVSGANLRWYLRNIVNSQLYAPLFLFTAIGCAWTIVGLARRRPIAPLSWELVGGAFVGWLGITNTFPHDTRYSMPLLLYLAVFGSGWIVRLPRTWRLVTTTALVLVVTANMLSTSFGVGTVTSAKLPGAASSLLGLPSPLTIYSNRGFLVAGPTRDGDVLGLMQTLRRDGVREIDWISLDPKEPSPEFSPDFSEAGLVAFAQIARLNPPSEPVALPKAPPYEAILSHGPVKRGQAPPCVELSDGTGVWVLRSDPNGSSSAKHYCPFRHPTFY